jgi:hypothetical protein
MVLQPSGDLTLDLYVDADFAGLWNAEDPNDPICVRSQTGYIFTLVVHRCCGHPSCRQRRQ